MSALPEMAPPVPIAHGMPALRTPDLRLKRQSTQILTFVTDQHRQVLLDSSASYVDGKLAFADAIVAAKRAGIDEEEIAQLTGLSVPMIRAVLRTP